MLIYALLNRKINRERYQMSKVCALCGKTKMTGNNVAHSKLKTKRALSPNLQKVEVEIDGKPQRVYVCTKCMKGTKND